MPHLQRGACTVLTCRLIHAPPDVIARYRATGVVDIPMARAIAATLSTGSGKRINGVPICHEFHETGMCTRPVACRYWYVMSLDVYQ